MVGWCLSMVMIKADAVQKIFKEAGYKQVRTVKDYGGNDRVTLGQWTQ